MMQTQFAYLTASARLSDNPSLVFSVTLTSGLTGDGVIIYDAHNANSEQISLHVAGETDITKQVDFNPPLYLSRGLYVEFETNTAEATIQFGKVGD